MEELVIETTREETHKNKIARDSVVSMENRNNEIKADRRGRERKEREIERRRKKRKRYRETEKKRKRDEIVEGESCEIELH